MQNNRKHKLNVNFNKRLVCKIYFLIFFVNIGLAQDQNAQNDYKIRTVVIDPGHGGKDSGALGKISKEKDIVLAIGLKLGNYIKENLPDVKVIFTRTTDEFIPLYQRAEIANKASADLYISIHANSNPKPEPNGAYTLVLGLHRADENFEVAKRENSVILLEDDYSARYENFDPNSPESYIIFSLLQNVYFDESINFAGMVQTQFRDRAKRIDRGVKQQGLLVLAQTSMPGVLIETGFISNPEEEKYLNSEDGQDYLASSIFRAFRDYKNEIESKTGPHNIKVQPLTQAKNMTSKEAIPKKDSLPISPNQIYFKVQITSGTNSIPLNSDIFKDLTNLEVFKLNDTYKYAAGSKTTYDAVVEYSKWVKTRYPDAFIIAVKNGQIISVQAALQELYNKPK
jgi:N-acetylmuramoyl-L-alanine amidase